MAEPLLRVAAKAVIINDENQLLLLRESAGQERTKTGLWGMSGGRLEPGEAFFEGLAREIAEETGLTADPIKPLHVGEWHPLINGTQLQIIAMFILCRTHAAPSDIKLSDEHDVYAWIDPPEYVNYKMMPPDDSVIKTLIQELKYL